jgi:hypothetical protein
MKRFDVVQGTTEWANLRLGIPTASQFHRIVTPGKLEFSKQSSDYINELLAEQVLGVPMDNATSGFMERGSVLEKKAIDFYELKRGVDVDRVGFVLRDDEKVGCSPDFFVEEDGLGEIKVPAADTHIAYLLDEDGIGYRLQVQGQLWLCGREWSDTLSYNPEMPAALVRQHRDEKVIKALELGVARFLEAMDDAKEKLQKKGLFKDFKRADLKVA